MSVLVPVKPYFKYGIDLKEKMPVIAYYCQLYAVQYGLILCK